MTQAAQAAKLIRSELKREFPAVKFKVQSDTFSMGDSVDVYYDQMLDENARKHLDEVISKYQYGSFNGMEDIYEYDNRHDFAQSKYVSANIVTDLSRY
jgi:hypothetical protein